ncbi:peptidoglycan D,D-transpeptidase FtsI family protein [Kurthia massiliensis]|uniref:peptidoglycan D,D-transpeptidase FtsI family protein n=1 Tax=Kurthia massiliensis TaxID=1033739 RepID=UPI0002897469|nr:penicillin-binding protein 2 [Kurthia massiliensis]
MRRKQKAKKTRAANPKAKLRASLSFRMNVLFFSIFVLFSVLILRLGYMQIVKGEEYVKELQKTEEVTVNTSVPRGRIYDRNGKVLVDNEAKNAITYTKYATTTQNEMLETATKLSKLIKIDTSKLTERDKQDYWIKLHPDEAAKKVSKEEQKAIQAKGGETSEIQRKIDDLTRDRITKKELKSFTKSELKVLAIYSKMRAGYNLSPQIIKSNDVSDKEFAIVSERLNELPGVSTTTDWARKKKSDLAILGRTTTPEEGIPADKLQYYLARDYSRNDRVGKSYLEQQYEDLLQGQKAIVKSETNSQGQVVDTKTVREGKAGKDLVITIDSKLQEQNDKIVEKYLLQTKAQGTAGLLDRAFLVMMDPHTGEILSMSGKKLEADENGKTQVVDYSIGAFTSSYEWGSAIKPSTLLTAYSYNAINPGQIIVDAPMRLGGTTKSSLFNKSGSVAISDLTALQKSSNVYMFKTALQVAGITYGKQNINSVSAADFQKMRNGYARFGLGVETGIDLPGEFTGFKGTESLPGKYLDLSIGQYDTYTPLQMAQYVSTVANGGDRIAPHLLKEVHEPSEDGKRLGNLDQEVEPNVLNHVNNSQSEIDHVKQGMWQVYNTSSGTANSFFSDAKYEAAGKTGTAEVIYSGPKKEKLGTYTITVSHVGFAPYDNPEIAYAIIVPWMSTTASHTTPNNLMAREAVDGYFKLKKQEMKSKKQTVGEKIKR